MTTDQWRKLTPSHQAEVWPGLSNAEKAAIIADDKDAMHTVAGAMVEQMADRPPTEPRRVKEYYAPDPAVPPMTYAAPTYRPAPFTTPAVCTLLNLLAVVSILAGVISVATRDLLSGIVLLASGVSLIAWSQMLDHIAQAAHYSREMVGLLARRQ